MSIFKRHAPATPPDLLVLRAREAQLVARQRALESELLDTPDQLDCNEILREINDLNAQIGVLRDAIKEFPI